MQKTTFCSVPAGTRIEANPEEIFEEAKALIDEEDANMEQLQRCINDLEAALLQCGERSDEDENVEMTLCAVDTLILGYNKMYE